MGSQARDNGLVDQIGGLTEVVSFIRKKAHLSEKGDTNLVMFPPRRTLLDVLTNPSTDTMVESTVWNRMRTAIPGLPGPSMVKGGVLSVLPYSLTVQ